MNLQHRIWPSALMIIWAIWWGGLSFYAIAVVPEGTRQIGSIAQGFITQKVTMWHNVVSVLMVIALAIESLRREGRTLVMLSIALTRIVILLMIGHAWLTSQMDQSEGSVASEFYSNHAIYLWLTAAEWFLGLSLPWFFLNNKIRISE